MGKAIKKSILRPRRVHTFEGSIRAIHPPQDCCYQQERDRSKSDPQSRDFQPLTLSELKDREDVETASALMSSQRDPFSESSTEPPFSERTMVNREQHDHHGPNTEIAVPRRAATSPVTPRFQVAFRLLDLLDLRESSGSARTSIAIETSPIDTDEKHTTSQASEPQMGNEDKAMDLDEDNKRRSDLHGESEEKEGYIIDLISEIEAAWSYKDKHVSSQDFINLLGCDIGLRVSFESSEYRARSEPEPEAGVRKKFRDWKHR